MTKATARFGFVGFHYTVFCFCLLLAGPGRTQPFFSEVTNEVFKGPLFTARGTAFGDYDNDGWPDLFFPENWWPDLESNRVALWHNEGKNRFVNHSDGMLPDIDISILKGGGTVWGDYDNDGDLDLFVPVGAFFSFTRSQNILLRNDRGTFHDVTFEAGLTIVQPSGNAIWLDYNRDSFLDLYVGNVAVGISLGPEGPAIDTDLDDPQVRNKLYHNNGDGTFEDVTEQVGLNTQLTATGGSNGGFVAGDVNNDGWPDLYVGVFNAPNHLFQNDGQGNFQDLSTGEVADPGQAHNVAIGDIDNDGDLDLFQAAGGGVNAYRSIALQNLGEGQFLDVLEGIGLSSLASVNLGGAGLADIDNDGDLDLLTAQPHFLFLNNGDGFFTDQTSQSGIAEISNAVSFGDYDADGFLDFASAAEICCGFNVLSSFHRMYRNNGNANHWLRIDLVGVESNRNGIGARLVARSGDLQQIREMLGGRGFEQDERIAHFGLATSATVDTLEIRWPSGQVDVLTDIPADQTIRVIEGRHEWYPAEKTLWETPPPESIVFGQEVDLSVVVSPALFEPTAEITSITADLSSLGGPEAVPLEALGDGTYRLDHMFTIGGESNLRAIEVLILQETSLGEYWINLSRNIIVEGDPNTIVLEDFSMGLPKAFTLDQNYPNPFNSSTVIRFALPESQKIELSVFNLAGQKVTTLVEGVREAGIYTVRWDGKHDQGQVLASGVYLYLLRVGGEQVETRKLVMVR